MRQYWVGKYRGTAELLLSIVLSTPAKKENGLHIINVQAVVFADFIWWAHTDSNRGPKDYESSALTN